MSQTWCDKNIHLLSRFTGKVWISYDAVMNMSINLAADGRKVSITGDRNILEKRWQNVEIDTFLVRLNQFYTDTRFHDFYTRHRSFYESVLLTYEQNVMQYYHQ